MNMEFAVFDRYAWRCKEIVQEQGANVVLIAVYQASCEQPLTRFTDAMITVSEATTRADKATTALAQKLEEMDKQFRIGRAAVAAVQPDTDLPDTLKSQRTDTDKRKATQRLVDVIGQHAGEPWADALLQGEFGETAAATIARLNDALEAQNALQKAKAERSAAYEPAWEAYRRFKRLVRNTLGSTSRQYRRIHMRAASAADELDETPVTGGTDAAPPAAPPAPPASQPAPSSP